MSASTGLASVPPIATMTSGCQATSSAASSATPLAGAAGEAPFDSQVSALDPAKPPQCFIKVMPGHCIAVRQPADADTSCRRLRHRLPRAREYQCGNKKVAPPHSITSSARASIDCGTVRPSAFAVFKLMTSSNFVGCWTGKSAGLAPLRIFPA